MTRNSAGAVSSIVLTLMLAFGGVASAQVGPDRGNPFGDILTTLRSIQNQNAQVDSQLLKYLEDLRRQMDKLEAGHRPEPSAHRVWVAPFWHERVTAAHVYALNPGRFDSDLRVVFVDKCLEPCPSFASGRRSVRRAVAHGGDRTLDLSSASLGPDVISFRGGGWVIVAGDRPVLPYGWFTVGWTGEHAGRNDIAMQFYPIDCTNPDDDTVSLACYYADPAHDPPQD